MKRILTIGVVLVGAVFLISATPKCYAPPDAGPARPAQAGEFRGPSVEDALRAEGQEPSEGMENY